MSIHVALISDYGSGIWHVYGEAQSFGMFACQLEDLGCQVIENQSDEWEGYTKEEVEEDACSIAQLLADPRFTPHM